MIKAGEKVRVGGREARVVSSWGQGKHKVFALDDGTTVMDLDEKIDGGTATIIPDLAPRPVSATKEKRVVRIQPLRIDDEDTKE